MIKLITMISMLLSSFAFAVDPMLSNELEKVENFIYYKEGYEITSSTFPHVIDHKILLETVVSSLDYGNIPNKNLIDAIKKQESVSRIRIVGLIVLQLRLIFMEASKKELIL